MAQAKDYKITTPYGYVKGYPLNGGFHRGEDRAMPDKTPVVVNGVQIGLSGHSGYATGPHLHIGRFINGAPTNPQGSGFTFKSAKVTQVGYDSQNGHYVRVQGDGASYVYLHLTTATCKVGQTLAVKPPIPIPFVRKYYKVAPGDTVTAICKKYGISLNTFKLLNPNIRNIDWIYVGQTVRVK